MKSTIKKTRFPSKRNPAFIIPFLLFLLFSYLLTLSGLLILSLLLYKLSISESAVNIGIIVIYIFSTFLTAYLCGRKMKKKKFLWGILLGTSYFLVLLLISLITKQTNVILGTNVLTAYMLCAGAGTLGGMLA